MGRALFLPGVERAGDLGTVCVGELDELLLERDAYFPQIEKQDTGRIDASLYAFEKTSKLVTVGLYRYICHPLYSSLFFLGWGVFFKSPS